MKISAIKLEKKYIVRKPGQCKINNMHPCFIWKRNFATYQNSIKTFEKVLGITKIEDWYKMTESDLKLVRPESPIHEHPYNFLKKAYPDYKWIAWKFHSVPHGFWKHMTNQRQYFKWLAEELNIKSPDDWFKVSIKDIESRGGAGLLKLYRNSLFAALKYVFPEHDWKPWLFERSSRNTWKSPSNVKQFVEEWAKELRISSLDDWYRISWDQVQYAKAHRLIRHYGGLGNVLKVVYPDHNWDLQRFSSKMKKSKQRELKIAVQELFPNEDVHEDYSKVFNEQTARTLRFDLYIPSLQLAFEYHGEQHYQDLKHFSPQRVYEERDKEKREQAAKQGITLVEVPFTWKGTKDEILSMIPSTIKSN